MSVSKNKALFEQTQATASLTLWPKTMAAPSCCDTAENLKHDPENLKYLMFGCLRRKSAGLWPRGKD